MDAHVFGILRGNWRLLLTALVVTAAQVAGGGEALGQAPSVRDRLTSEIDRGVRIAQGSERDAVLRGLRSMRDESLRAFFARLANSDDAQLRRHGVLALGELSEDGSVSPAQLAQIENKALRASIVGEAVGAGLLGAEQIRGVLGWPDLEPSLEILLSARLLKMGDEVDVERLDLLAESSDGATAAYALLVLASMGEPERAERSWSALAELPGMVKWKSVGVLLGRIADEDLMNCAPFVESVLNELGTSQEGVDRSAVDQLAVRAMLVTAPLEGEALWRARFDGADSVGKAMRWALIGASAWETAPVSMLEEIAGDRREAIAQIGHAAVSLRQGSDARVVEALAVVLSQESSLLRGWALDSVGALDEEQRAVVLEAVALRMLADDEVRSDVMYAVGRSLGDADPDRLEVVVRRAAERGSEALDEALLAAVLQVEIARLWAADEEPEWAGRTSSHMAAIAAARWGESSEDVEERVVGAGLGESLLPRPLRVQAAWLGLRLRGEQRQALSQLLAAW